MGPKVSGGGSAIAQEQNRAELVTWQQRRWGSVPYPGPTQAIRIPPQPVCGIVQSHVTAGTRDHLEDEKE